MIKYDTHQLWQGLARALQGGNDGSNARQVPQAQHCSERTQHTYTGRHHSRTSQRYMFCEAHHDNSWWFPPLVKVSISTPQQIGIPWLYKVSVRWEVRPTWVDGLVDPQPADQLQGPGGHHHSKIQAVVGAAQVGGAAAHKAERENAGQHLQPAMHHRRQQGSEEIFSCSAESYMASCLRPT